MRYEKLISIYNNIEFQIKEKNFKNILKSLLYLSKSFNYYGKLPYSKADVYKYTMIILKDLGKNCKNAHFYYQIGLIMFFINDLKTAEKYLKKAIKIKNNRSKYYLSLAYVYERLSEKKLMVENLDIAESIDQFNMELLLLKGRMMEFDGETDKALYYYNIATDVKPNRPQPHFMKGRCLFLDEKLDEAITELNIAYNLMKPNDFAMVDLLTLLAEIYFEKKNYKKSFNLFDKIFEIFHNRPEPYYVKSEILFSIARENEALKLIDKAIALSPNDESRFMFYIKKASFLNLLSRTDEAIRCIKKALKINDKDVKLLDMYGEILTARSEYEKSIEIYKKRLTLEEDNLVYLSIAEDYFSLGNYTEAYNYINKFINIDGTFSQAYILRAKINAVQGYKTLAMSDLNKALFFGNDSVLLYENDFFYLSNLEGMEEFRLFLETIENHNE